TYDMALSATSGTLNRNLDYRYICYDNEAYGSTGMQQPSATPYAARTATAPGGAGERGGLPFVKKDVFEIRRAHKPPYIATVSPRHPLIWHASSRRPSNSRDRSSLWRLPHVPGAGCTILRRPKSMLNWVSSAGSFP